MVLRTNRDFILNQDAPSLEAICRRGPAVLRHRLEDKPFRCDSRAHRRLLLHLLRRRVLEETFVTDMQKRFDTDVKDKCTSMLQMSVKQKDDTFEIH